MKNPKTLLVVFSALALIAFGFFFVRGPKPIIEIKGEEVGALGPLPILNTMVTAVTVTLILIIVAWFGTRKLNLIPRGLQNVVEAIAEALLNLCIATAGEKHGRRFFPVAATIFVFIWIANWMALTPVFNSFGTVNKVDAHHFSDEATLLTEKGPVEWIFPFSLGGNDPLYEFEVDETEVAAIEDEIVEAKAAGASKDELHTLEVTKEDALEHARERAIAAQMPRAAGLKLDYAECDPLEGEKKSHCKEEINLEHAEEAAAIMEADGKRFAIIHPFFRSMNTDLNTPLSLAIISVIFIEIWGIMGLGFFKYGAKFVNFSSPIAFFVGFLEAIAEMARVISFTFRLFGNMLAGEILLLVMTFLIPFLIALPFYFLEVFVGVVQAFVFFTLTVAFGALAVASHDEHDPHGDDHDGGHEIAVSPPVAEAVAH